MTDIDHDLNTHQMENFCNWKLEDPALTPEICYRTP